MTPWTVTASLSVANPNRDGTGTIVAIKTGAAAGVTRFDRLRIQATGVTTAGFVRLFVTKSGGSAKLFREYPVQAITPGTLDANGNPLPAWSQDVDCTNARDALYLQNGDVLSAAPNNAEAFNVFAMGGD